MVLSRQPEINISHDSPLADAVLQSHEHRRMSMKLVLAPKFRMLSVVGALALAATGCMTDRGTSGDRYSTDTSGSFPASNNDTAGPMSLSLWCRQHYSEPRCASGTSNDLTGPR